VKEAKSAVSLFIQTFYAQGGLNFGKCGQRVMIALALACNPQLLIADEPTTGLDVTTQAAIMELVSSLARERKMATILITHDLALASEYCDRIVVMHAGHLVEAAPTGVLPTAVLGREHSVRCFNPL
jgi:peptide/nickel transport system ATP-binding protein